MQQSAFNRDKESTLPSVSTAGTSTDALIVEIDTLYRDHHHWLFAWLRKKLSCQHQAADIAHDTFTRLLSLSHLPCLQEPRAYLVTTAKRLLIDQTRKQRIEQAYLAELTRAAEAIDGFPSAEDIAAVVQILDKISQILAGLAEKPRQAFLLHYFDGLTHAAVAAQLGVSDRMVRKYLVQALVHCHQFHIPD
ncbi:MAG: sigma-70 family RNA polymerase sigma factor [Nitrosomonas sp.]|nr:sigma-70 family RNA polymerase sigma factor [Nitrosomonas sp.]MCW5607387.1 sigma-70 family RNA polymerase sigma factor [Nitrosomonas sp.]